MSDEKFFSEVFAPRFLVEALLEDYAKMISKLEGTSEKEIKIRITDRATSLFEDYKNNLSDSSQKE